MKTSQFLSILVLLSMIGSASDASAQKKKTAPAKTTEKPIKHERGTVYRARPAETDTLVEISTSMGTMIVRLYKETPLHRSNFIKLASEGFYDSLMFHRVIGDFMIQGGDPTSRNADSTAFLGGGDIGYRIPAEFNSKLFHKKGALAAARDGNPEKASSGCQFYIVQGKKITTQELSNFINGVNYQNKMMLLQEYTGRDSVKEKLTDYNTRGDQAGLDKYMMEVRKYVDAEFEKKIYMPTAIQISEYVNHGGTPHLDNNYTVFGEVVSGWEVIDKIATVKTNAQNRPLQDVRMKMKILIR